jgi:hypothetical protein
MPARSPRASGRVTPKGTSNGRSSTPPASPRQRAVPARRPVERNVGGRPSGPSPAAFRRTGHR